VWQLLQGVPACALPLQLFELRLNKLERSNTKLIGFLIEYDKKERKPAGREEVAHRVGFVRLEVNAALG